MKLTVTFHLSPLLFLQAVSQGMQTVTWQPVLLLSFCQEFITGRVCNFHMVSVPAIWIG